LVTDSEIRWHFPPRVPRTSHPIGFEGIEVTRICNGASEEWDCALRRSSTYEIEGTPMFVTVIHRIHDPEGFQAAEAKALEAGLPSSVALPIHAATSDHALGICIWEGESVEAVREVAEGAIGPYANNEYYEMHVDGLTPQLAN
jgi:hypothetical protein